MTSTAQALHVARKDVRYTRWALIVYSALVLVALVHALALPLAAGPNALAPNGVGRSNPLSMTMLVLVLLGIILAATAVQADSPVQSNAFWASRPFGAGAMVGAKLLYCGVVLVGMPLIAEAIGMLRYNVIPGALAATLIQSVLIYGLVLLCTAVVAALTTDLRGFIVGALVLVVGFFIIGAILSDSGSRAFANPSKLVSVAIAVGAGVALLMALYRRRGVGWIAWVGAVIVVGAAFVAFDAIDGPSATQVPASLRSATISLDVVDQVRFTAPNNPVEGKARMVVRFNMASIPQTARLAIQIDSAQLHLRNGSVIRAGSFYGYISADDGFGALPAGIRPFGSSNEPLGVSTSLTFNADSAKVTAVGIASVDVWSRVEVAEAVPLATTRVGSPIAAAVGGTRIRVFDNFDTDANAITVFTATVGDPRRPSGARDIGMSVINESSREGIVLTSSNYSNSNDWMVLPGAPINTSFVRLNTNRPEAEGPTIIQSVPGVGPIAERIAGQRRGQFPDPAWYRNARITVVRWIPRGSYPLHLSKTLN
jgi:hypothetical protein